MNLPPVENEQLRLLWDSVSATPGWLSPENPSHVSIGHSDWPFSLGESERE